MTPEPTPSMSRSPAASRAQRDTDEGLVVAITFEAHATTTYMWT